MSDKPDNSNLSYVWEYSGSQLARDLGDQDYDNEPTILGDLSKVIGYPRTRPIRDEISNAFNNVDGFHPHFFQI